MSDRVAVIGGGILGVAIAREILTRRPDVQVTLFEKEDRLAAHQTGRNSGVVHAGLYYEPGSAKATLCRRGVALLQDFCVQRGILRIECGKVLVALDDAERTRLGDIEERALANGVPGVRTIGPEELRELEPHVRGVAALHSPTTSIVDFAEVTRALAADAVAAGATILLGQEVIGLRTTTAEVVVTVRTAGGAYQATFDQVVACGGLQSDRLAEIAGDETDPVIMPFRGEYYALKPERAVWSTGWCIRCPTRDTRSSESTSPTRGRRGARRSQRGAGAGPRGVHLADGLRARPRRDREHTGILAIRTSALAHRHPRDARLAQQAEFVAADVPMSRKSATTTSCRDPLESARRPSMPTARWSTTSNQPPRPHRAAAQRTLTCRDISARDRRARRVRPSSVSPAERAFSAISRPIFRSDRTLGELSAARGTLRPWGNHLLAVKRSRPGG